MDDLFADLDRWSAAGKRIVVATVIEVSGSGPRPPGSAMAVNEDGEVSGSVSGGCVEGAVVTEALGVLAGAAPRLISFGYSDDDAFAVGLTCGGTIRLFLAEIDPAAEPYDALRVRIAERRPVALATVVDGPHTGAAMLIGAGDRRGALGDHELERVVERDGRAELDAGRSTLRHYGPHGQPTPEDLATAETVVFIASWSPPPAMIIFGAVDFTAALAAVAKLLGYHVVVCDAREVFATRRRFPMADEVIVSWPGPLLTERGPALGPNDAVCILTHDAKFDVPAIEGALASAAGYIGVMGSRATHARRLERLAEVGISDPADLDRLMSPIGLDLGARTPEETAISICAEIIARRTGRQVPSLRDARGPIH